MATWAPPHPAGFSWLNVARPLLPDELTGWLRVLLFWTGGSVACHHAIQVLTRLQRRFDGEPVLFIGVHASRLRHERSIEGVRAAVLRQGVALPVVLDADLCLWRHHGIRHSPTVVVVDPAGQVVVHDLGEPDEALLEAEIVHCLARARAENQEVAISPLPLQLEVALEGELVFPSKLLARGERLWVGSGRGEVVEYSLPAGGPARLVRRYRGLGRPHGLALDERAGLLYVADPARHSIWRVDLARPGEPEPVAGTGQLGTASLAHGAFAPGREVALRSPWDLCWDAESGRLLVAMAGAHQVWTYEPARDRLRVLAGSGREARHDGDLEDSAFAQPSGLALEDKRLWVGDAGDAGSGGGCIRLLDLQTSLVRTVAGGDLLEVGHVDGAGDDARFQRPTGLALLPDGAGVVVADGGCGALRRVERAGGVVTPLTTPGLELLEPDGLAFHAGRLLVADSGHHRVVAVDLASGAWEVVAGAGSG